MLHLITGPPRSGKTDHLLALAHSLSNDRQHLYWIGLPHQRDQILHRLAERGSLLGVQYYSLQQLYYRLLQDHPDLKPLAGPGLQLANVARALTTTFERTPTPGEATLYHAAIREHKRAALDPTSLSDDPISRELQRVYRAYQHHNRDTWDYEDYRANALRRITSDDKLDLPALLIDGFLELNPTDLLVIHALAKRCNVHLALEREPAGLRADKVTRLEARAGEGGCEVLRFANPVQETRWVLRALKRDLGEGAAARELVVITPEAHKGAFLALAEEYGVPVRDASPLTLAEHPAGRLLTRLLALPNDPNRLSLSSIPDLASVGDELARLGLHGREASERIAHDLGISDTLRHWQAYLTPPTDRDALHAWIDSLLTLVTELDPSIDTSDPAWPNLRESIAARGAEAGLITSDDNLRHWWTHLLERYPDPTERAPGIALANPIEASGLRYQRAYLTRATLGEYAFENSEDYFVPEERRLSSDELTNAATARALPQRISGRTRTLLTHLLERGDALTISYPEANQDGPLAPETLLTGLQWSEPPELPAGSARELGSATNAHALTINPIPSSDGSVAIKHLQAFNTCAFRGRFEPHLDDPRPEPWLALLKDLRRDNVISHERIAELQYHHPRYRAWLERHQDTLTRLTINHHFSVAPDLRARAHAQLPDPNEPQHAHYLYFASPHRLEPDDATKRTRDDWERVSVIHYALESLSFERVTVSVWPIDHDPVEALTVAHDPSDGELPLKKLRAPNLRTPLERYRSGVSDPKPGFHCRTCRARDVCRAAT